MVDAARAVAAANKRAAEARKQQQQAAGGDAAGGTAEGSEAGGAGGAGGASGNAAGAVGVDAGLAAQYQSWWAARQQHLAAQQQRHAAAQQGGGGGGEGSGSGGTACSAFGPPTVADAAAVELGLRQLSELGVEGAVMAALAEQARVKRAAVQLPQAVSARGGCQCVVGLAHPPLPSAVAASLWGGAEPAPS
jgi:hypothetical protein